MKHTKGVPKGVPVLPPECYRCGTKYGVRWISFVSASYSFSGYFCEECEPHQHQEEKRREKDDNRGQNQS